MIDSSSNGHNESSKQEYDGIRTDHYPDLLTARPDPQTLQLVESLDALYSIDVVPAMLYSARPWLAASDGSTGSAPATLPAAPASPTVRVSTASNSAFAQEAQTTKPAPLSDPTPQPARRQSGGIAGSRARLGGFLGKLRRVGAAAVGIALLAVLAVGLIALLGQRSAGLQRPSPTPASLSDLQALAKQADVIAQVRFFSYSEEGQDAVLGMEVQQWLKNGAGAVTSTKVLFLRVPPDLWAQMPDSFKSTRDPAGNYGKDDTYVIFLSTGPADPTYGVTYNLTGGPRGAFLILNGKITESAFPQYKGMSADDFKRLIPGEPTPVPTVAAQDTATRVPGSSPVSLAREGDGFRLDIYEGVAHFDFGSAFPSQSPWIGPSRLLVERSSSPATPTGACCNSTYLLDTASGNLVTMPDNVPNRYVFPSPDGSRAVMLWQYSTLRLALYDFSSGTQQVVADIDPTVQQWAGPDANLTEFKPDTEVFVYATVTWAGNNSFALTLRHETQAGEEYNWDKALLVDIAQQQVRVLANRGIVVGAFPDGSVLFRPGRIDGAIQLYRPGDRSITTLAPSGPWTTGWSISPDGKKAAWLEMTPPPGDWSKRLPNGCCSSDPSPIVKDIVVFDLATGQTRRYDVSGFAWNSPDVGWMQSYKLMWSNDSTALLYGTHPTDNHTTLYRLPLGGPASALAEMDKRAGIDLVAEGNDGSIYYMMNGIDCQNCSQLMRHTADGKTEIVHANSIPYDWEVDAHNYLEEFKDGGVLVTDLATGQSHQVNFPGVKVDEGQLGNQLALMPNVGALVPISPDGNWAAYAGSESDAIVTGDRGRTVRIVRIK